MNKKILLVEDEALIAMAEAQMLKEHGYEVVTAYNGESAIGAVDSDPDISLILMDIDLGKGMDGTEAAERILNKKDIPVVFLSSHTEPQVVEKTEKITSYGYVVKNSGANVLDASIKMAFRLFAARMKEKEHREALLHSYSFMSYIIEHNQSAVAVHDRDLKYIYVSKQYLNQYNVEKRDIIGKHHYEVFPDLPQKWREVHKRALAGEVSKGEDDPYEHEDGTIEWTRWECRPWYEADGTIGGFIIYTEVVSKERQTKFDVRDSTNYLQSILRTTRDGFWVLDLKGDFIDVNKAYCEMTGYNRNDFFHMNISDIDADEKPQDTADRIQRIISTGSDIFQARHRRKDGSIFDIEVSASFLGGEQDKFVCFGRDITERKQAEEELKASRDLLNATQKIAGVGGWEWDIATDTVTWSEELYNITGLDPNAPPPQFNDDHHKIYTKKSWQKLTQAVENILKTGEPYEIYAQMIRPDGELRDVFIYGGSNFDNDGSMSGLFGIVEDITDKNQREKQLRESEENLRITLDSIGDAVISTDIDGAVIRMNPVAEELCGWCINEAKGKSLTEVFRIVHADTGEKVENPVAKVLETGSIIGLANHTMLISKDGTKYQIADSAAPIRDDNGNTTGVVLVFRDVTEEYEKERQLQERVKELRSIEWMLSNKTTQQEEYIPEYGDLSEQNKDGLIVHSVGKEQLKDIVSGYLDLLETSTAVYEKDGSYALGILTSGWCRLMDSASRRLCTTEDNKEALESGKWLCHESCWNVSALTMSKDRPVEFKCNGGIRMYGVPVHAGGETVGAINFGYGSPPTDEAELKTLSQKYKIPVAELREQAEAYNPRPQFIIEYAKERIRATATQLGRLIDRKQAEEALREGELRFRTLADSGQALVWTSGVDKDCDYFNQPWLDFTGRTLDEELGGGWIEGVHSDDRDRCVGIYVAAFERREPFSMSYRLRRADGEYRWIQDDGTPRYDNDGKFLGYIGHCLDITELKDAEDKLRKALEEKEFLMKELNHRVKNSLLMVSSLINLKDSETENDLSDIQHQIEAVGLIHEKLYQTGNVKEICCRDYISDLLSSIFSSFSRQPVRIEADVEEICIPTQSAMSLGLIINEIATNAIKHGFSDTEEAVFSTRMEKDKENNQYKLTLSNTGSPFPEDIDLDNPQTLGLRLISALTEQLDGTIELQREPHPVFTIRFPIEEE